MRLTAGTFLYSSKEDSLALFSQVAKERFAVIDVISGNRWCNPINIPSEQFQVQDETVNLDLGVTLELNEKHISLLFAGCSFVPVPFTTAMKILARLIEQTK